MEDQLESIGQQRLKHAHHLGDRRIAFRSRIHVEPVSVHPRGATVDLRVAIGRRYQSPQCCTHGNEPAAGLPHGQACSLLVRREVAADRRDVECLRRLGAQRGRDDERRETQDDGSESHVDLELTPTKRPAMKTIPTAVWIAGSGTTSD